MRNLALSALLILLLVACADRNKNVEVAKPATPNINLDSAGMAETIHTFYKWYGEAGKQLITKINFVNTEAKHPRLDLGILGKYLGEFAKSGAICTEFIQNETVFYRACGLAWAEQKSGDILTGFEVDRYYCQQDADPAEFLTAGTSYKMDGEYAIVQLMLDPKGPNGGPRDFEMKKQNGRWLLSKYICNAAYTH